MLKQNKAAFLFHILVGQPVITRGLFSQGPVHSAQEGYQKYFFEIYSLCLKREFWS